MTARRTPGVDAAAAARAAEPVPVAPTHCAACGGTIHRSALLDRWVHDHEADWRSPRVHDVAPARLTPWSP